MSLKKLSIADVDVASKRVLIRVDFNVPQDKKDPSVPPPQRSGWGAAQEQGLLVSEQNCFED